MWSSVFVIGRKIWIKLLFYCWELLLLFWHLKGKKQRLDKRCDFCISNCLVFIKNELAFLSNQLSTSALHSLKCCVLERQMNTNAPWEQITPFQHECLLINLIPKTHQYMMRIYLGIYFNHWIWEIFLWLHQP